MPIATLRPDGDVVNNWTKSTGTSGAACIDDAVTQPTNATTGGDGASISGTTTAGTEQEVSVGTFSLGAGVVSTATLWFYYQTASKRGVDVRLLHGTTQLGSTLSLTHTASTGWYSIVYTGTLTQAQIDDLRAEWVVRSTAGGGGASAPVVHAAYIEVDYTLTQTVSGGIATSSDTALAGSAAAGVVTLVGGLPTTVNAALAGAASSTGGSQTVAGGIALEVSEPLAGIAMPGAVAAAGGTPNESAEALAGTASPGVVAVDGGIATSSDSALAGVAGTAATTQTINGGIATETNTTLAGTLAYDQAVAGGIALENTAALTGTAIPGIATITGGEATTTTTALPGTVAQDQTIAGGIALETSEALAATVTDGTTPARAYPHHKGGSWHSLISATPPVATDDEDDDDTIALLLQLAA